MLSASNVDVWFLESLIQHRYSRILVTPIIAVATEASRADPITAMLRRWLGHAYAVADTSVLTVADVPLMHRV